MRLKQTLQEAAVAQVVLYHRFLASSGNCGRADAHSSEKGLEARSAKQPQKGQCIPEPRWDSRSTIDMNASDAMWSMYNLQYVRTLGLRVRSDGKVRLVQAFKAVMRRLVISGGPYSIYLPQHERRQRVREIEILEDMMLSATEEIEPELPRTGSHEELVLLPNKKTVGSCGVGL
ncbi:Muscle calcium channel subunit alpha-1, partial [Durusdinium trenchii]